MNDMINPQDDLRDMMTLEPQEFYDDSVEPMFHGNQYDSTQDLI